MGFIIKEYNHNSKGKYTGLIDVATGNIHGNVFSSLSKEVIRGQETLEEYQGILSGAPMGIKGKQIDIKMGVGSLILDHTVDTIKSRFHDQAQHLENVEGYSREIGKALDLKKNDLNTLGLAAKMHDIGKAFIEPGVLNKAENLTKEEMEEIKKHPEIGYWLLKADKRHRKLAQYVRHHHERWDGLGYPGGLKGEEIPLFSRIIAVADAYDAMITMRVYQKKRSPEEAAQELLEHSGNQFDPNIVKTFLKEVVEAFPNNSRV